MENKAHALMAGLFVATMALLLLVLAAWLTRDAGVRHVYEIATTETVAGLQAQAPVRYRGVDVGRVSAVGFDPDVPGQVLIRMDIEDSAPMNRDTYATLSYQGVTGLAFVQLLDAGRAAERLPPNDASPPRVPLRPSLFARLETRGEALLDQVESLTRNAGQLVGDGTQQRLADTLIAVTAAASSLDGAARSAQRLVQGLEATTAARVDPVLSEAVVTMRSLRSGADAVGRTAADLGQVVRRIEAQDGPIDRLTEGTQALVQAANALNATTLPRINRVADEASRAMRQLGRTANTISDNPQGLIFGAGQVRPGPGEPGFAAPEAAR